MILRWLEILASFNFTVKHQKGTLYGNADSLSRPPHASFPTLEEEKVLVSDEVAVVAIIQAPPGFATEEIKDHQERDEHLRDVQKSETEKQLLTRGGSLHSCLPCIRILPPASGVFRLKKKGP